MYNYIIFTNIYMPPLTRLFHRDIDKVDDLMAEITEQQEVAQEISDVISRPVGFGEDYDEVRAKQTTKNMRPTETKSLNLG